MKDDPNINFSNLQYFGPECTRPSHSHSLANASRKLPLARNFRSEDEIFAISLAKPFAFASEFLHNAKFAALSLRFDG